MENTNQQPLTKRALSITEACASSSISRSGLYIEIKMGRLKARKIRGRTVILPADLDAWLESAPEAGVAA